MKEPRPFARSPAALAAAAALLVLLVSEAIFSRLGGSPADFTLFLGRLHPLAVHLPIGVLVLVAAGEALSFSAKLRPRVDPALGLALAALLLSSLAAFLLGQLLGRSGDFAPRLLKLHRRLELFAVAGACFCFAAWAFHASTRSARSRALYRLLLGSTLALMCAGAHFGGIMTRGETYLSRYAPGPLKALLGGEPEKETSAPPEAPRAEPTLYTAAVAPLLNERCVECHGPDKAKGGLRLDTFAGIQKGGEDGKVVTPGAPADSPLLSLILLPLDDDGHMPPEEKPQPTAAEIALLRFWIERGANDELLLRDTLAPGEARALLETALRTALERAPDAPPVAPAPAPSASHTASSTSSGSPPSANTRADSPAPGSAPAKPALVRGPPPPGASPVTSVPETPAASRSARAILTEACESCHGAQKQKGRLRVDSVEALLAGGKSGPALVPGQPDASELIRRIELPLSDEKHMPPDDQPQLDAGELRTLRAWVRGLTQAERAARSGAEVGSPPALGSTAKAAATGAPAGTREPAPAQPDGAPPAAASATEAPVAADVPATPEELAKLPPRIVLYPDAVGPLLVERCGPCHAGEKPAMGLSVESHAALMKGGLSGPAVVPGEPDRSLLIERVMLPLDDGEHMPPEDEPQLTTGELALLRDWIEHGAGLAFEVNTSELSPEVRSAIARRAPETWTAVAAPPPAVQSGGCGACAAGGAAGHGFGSWALAVLVSAGLVLRRAAARDA